MRTKMRKPLAVLLSALMLLTVVSVGLVPLASFAAPVTGSMDLDYSLGAGTYTNGQYRDTGYHLNWDRDFELNVTFRVTSPGLRYVIIGGYNNASTRELNIELDDSHAGCMRVYFGTGQLQQFSSTAVAANDTVTMKFNWNASTYSYTLTAVGASTNISMSGSYPGDLSGTSAEPLLIGASDHRAGTSPFNTIYITSASFYAQHEVTDHPTNVVYDYNKAIDFAAGEYADTGYYIDWSRSFTLEQTFRVPALGRRYLMFGGHNGQSAKELNLEVNTNNTFRVYIGGPSGQNYEDSSTAVIAANDDITMRFTWFAQTKTYALTAKGSSTNIVMGGSLPASLASGTAANPLRMGTADHRGSSEFYPITVSDIRIYEYVPAAYAAGDYYDTGSIINWDRDFTIRALFRIPAADVRYVVCAGYNGTSQNELNIEINSNKIRVYFGVTKGDHFSDGTVAIGKDVDMLFTWTAASKSWTLRAVGSGTNISMSGTADMAGSATKTLRLGARDYRPAEIGPFQAITLTGFIFDGTTPAANTAALFTPAAHKGYTFSHWNTKADNSGTSYNSGAVASLTPSNSTGNTVYAQWTPNVYTIAFDANGGTGETAAVSATYDVDAVLTANGFVKTGYHFTGWKDAAGTDYANTATVRNLTATNGGTVTLSAQWAPNDYTISFNGNATDVTGATAPIDATYDVSVPLTSNGFNRLGYSFDGWAETPDGAVVYTNGQTVSNLTATHNGSVTLYAHWTAKNDTPYLIRDTIMNSEGSYTGVEAAERLHTGTTDTTVNAADVALDIAHYTLDLARSDASINIDGDGSAVMNLYYKAESHTVLFKNTAGETVQTDTLCYGAVPAYTGETPALAATGENTYTFLGWTANAAAEPGSDAAYYAAGNLPPVTADVTYYPYFGAAVNSYDITFVVGDDSTAVSFPYGATPAYNGVPAKAAEAGYTYAFAGWNTAADGSGDPIAPVTADETYYAQFTATLRQYPVFVTSGAGSEVSIASQMADYDTVVDFTVTVAEGYDPDSLTVTANGTDISALGTDQGNGVYAFSLRVLGDTAINVQDLDKITFNITFKVEDDETVKTVAYGETPAYGSVPAKASTAQYEYTFTGWTPEIVPAAADAAYTAQFSEATRSYPVSFYTDDGVNTISVAYGDVPDPGFTPARAADAEYTYEFAGWSDEPAGSVVELAQVTGAKRYYAQFTATPIPATLYLVTATAGVGTTIGDITGNYAEGATVSFDVTVTEGYNAAGLVVSVNGTAIDNPEPVSGVYSYAVEVTGAAAITVADLDKNVYTVVFDKYDGAELYSTTVIHGDDVAYVGQTPMKPADENVYTFTGWSASTNNVTGNLTVTAQYSSEPLVIHTHDYSINCYDADYHWMGCACGAVEGEKTAHTFVSAHNAAAHWEACDCGYRKNSEAHTFTAANDASCHWEACACGEIRNKEAHNFTTTDYDADGHWQVCADCGALSASEAHVLTLTHNTTQHCLACDCGYTEGAENHTLATQHDATGHWQTCACGYATAKEAHSFDTETDAGAATCSTLAYSVKACACGETQRTESGSLDPDTHTGPYKVVGARAATETADGYTGDTICLGCGEVTATGTVIPRLDPGHTHSYDTEIETGEATCVAPAYVIKQCECGATQKTESGNVDPDAHTGPYKVVGARDATTTAEGYTGDKICLACGGTVEAGHYTDMIADPHEHDYATVTESGAATCVAPAYEIKVCACGAEKRFDGDTLDPDNHVHTILVGARAATATTDGYTGDTVCTACGNTVSAGTVIPKTDPGHTHSYDTEIESGVATCVAKAYTIYACACGDVKKVETGEVNANNHAGEIKLMGYHAATETADGYSGDKYCLACGNLVEAGHVLEHTGSTTPENPTEPTRPDNNGGGSTDTRIPFWEWLVNFFRKILSLFKINAGGDDPNC